MNFKDILSPKTLATTAALASALSFNPEAAQAQTRVGVGVGVITRRGGGSVYIGNGGYGRYGYGGYGRYGYGGYGYGNLSGPPYPQYDRRNYGVYGPVAPYGVYGPPIISYPNAPRQPDPIQVGGTDKVRYVDENRNVMYIGGFDRKNTSREATAFSACDGTVIWDDGASKRVKSGEVAEAIRQHKPTCVVYYSNSATPEVVPQTVEQMLGETRSLQIFVSVAPGKKEGEDNSTIFVKDRSGRWVNAGPNFLDTNMDPAKFPKMAEIEQKAIQNLGQEKYNDLVCRAVVNNPGLTDQEARQWVDAKPQFKGWLEAGEKDKGTGNVCAAFSVTKADDFRPDFRRGSVRNFNQPNDARLTDGQSGARINRRSR